MRGTYELRAEGDGDLFETTSVIAEVTAFGSAPQTFTQNIQLRLKPGRSMPTTGVVSAEDVDVKIPDAARKDFEKGVKRANDNKPEQALKHFQDAITAYPTYYAAITAMAEQYSKLQRYEESVTAFKKAIEMKPDRPEAHTGLGMSMVRQQKYTEAIPPLRRGAELDKQSFTPHLFLGLSEMMTGDYSAAETDLLRAYDMGKPAIAHLYLANLYDLRGEPQKALERLETFLRENPNMPENRKIEIREVMEKLRKQMKAKK
jgi:Tfp pilus assembly protein PilF